jgi:hypothetical protein
LIKNTRLGLQGVVEMFRDEKDTRRSGEGKENSTNKYFWKIAAPVWRSEAADLVVSERGVHWNSE